MSISPADFEFMRRFVLERSAIVLDESKQYLVETRLETLLRTEGSSESPSTLIAKLRAAPTGALADKVVDAMTTNETSFFRDLHPFDALRRDVLPELIQRNAADRSLSIWCGAASSGQEPFTIAMTILEGFPQIAGWKLKFVATDISHEMLARCREGRYSQLEVNRGLPAPLLVKYFDRDGLHWRIKDSLRRMVEFRELNLVGSWPMLPALDIVFLRNVLIYFDAPTKQKIFARIHKAMKPDGYLFLGAAESTLGYSEAFERAKVGATHCFRPRATVSSPSGS
ncbi:MAG: protein-glutamate O-methyltransferase CheR [Planctomycetes bacterium]|nr:protein-glutamate O-methyltransferase CheR [Planctomycetota bacterium]